MSCARSVQLVCRSGENASPNRRRECIAERTLSTSILIVGFSENIGEKEIHRMYKVELSFDIESLDAETVREICEKTDAIFEREDLKCTESQPGRRVYLDRGRAQDYGRF